MVACCGRCCHPGVSLYSCTRHLTFVVVVSVQSSRCSVRPPPSALPMVTSAAVNIHCRIPRLTPSSSDRVDVFADTASRLFGQREALFGQTGAQMAYVPISSMCTAYLHCIGGCLAVNADAVCHTIYQINGIKLIEKSSGEPSITNASDDC